MTPKQKSAAGLLALAALVLALLSPSAASALTGPRWQLDSLADTAVKKGSFFDYAVSIRNLGDLVTTPGACPGAECQAVQIALPAGIVAKAVAVSSLEAWACEVSDPHHVKCTTPHPLPPMHAYTGEVLFIAEATSQASGTEIATIAASGGGAPPATIHDATRIEKGKPSFGFDAFDGGAQDPAGQSSTAAAAHPDGLFSAIDYSRGADPTYGGLWPPAAVRDTAVSLPPGLIGNPSAVATCTSAQLAQSAAFSPVSLCPAASQVGVVTLEFNHSYTGRADAMVQGPVPVFNMAAPPGVAARFGFSYKGTVTVLDATVRGGSDYGVTVTGAYVPEPLALLGAQFDFWGVPASPSHDAARNCPGQYQRMENPAAPACDAAGVEVAEGEESLPGELVPFLRNPTACEGPLTTSAYADSWSEPGAVLPDGSPDLSDPRWKSASYVSHQPPGYPNPPSEWGAPAGIEECDAVPFQPQATVAPTTHRADSPSGLSVDLSLPQTCWQAEEAGSLCQSDLKAAEVTLPAGMSVNPSSAGGLEACTSGQIGLLGTEFAAPAPIHFTDETPNCPDGSKIGTAEVTTPLLDHTIGAHGELGVYLAAQGDNPFHSLLALYIAGRDPQSGVVLKLAGKIEADPNTGQLKTVFDNQPQQPFESLHLEMFGGPRAALRTPSACGEYRTQTALRPWARPEEAVSESSSFKIDEGCGGGFAPKLTAGTTNPLAGQTSPFMLRLTREDGEQALGGLSVTLPPGLSGYLKGIPYCSDAALAGVSGNEGTGRAQEASPSCPAASQVGTVTVGAGAGSNPFYTSSGRAYLAGPYKGAPLSLAVVTPAVAGPFDLGSVVVRNALHVDPLSAQINAVSDPLPTILHGVPLDLRDVRVDLSRQHFTLNPTSCDEMHVNSTITSAGGAAASPSSRFQVGNCTALAFKPKLSLRLKGGTKRSKHPALRAVLTAREGDANLGRIQVALPHSEFLAQNHIRTICTRVQFAAGGGGGEQCPAGSVYGHVTATSPILGYPLTGNVYLRSSSHPLPDMVLALHGPPSQPIQIETVGRIDSFHRGIRSTFETVPDAPLSRVVLSMLGGKRGLLENSTNICARPQRAAVQMDAQNNKVHDFSAPLMAKCPKRAKHGHRRHRGGHR